MSGRRLPTPSPATQEPAAGVAVPVSAGRVTDTCSAVLFDALAGVYDSLGFGAAVGDEVFRNLVIARMVESSSLADAARVLTELGQRPASYSIGTVSRSPMGRSSTG
ncbi:hypothetical protein KO481_42485 [Nocardia sp. NEAU-G5]|uniref:Uncharacterized protein n=1 Tax=Nocardia albiluteola TaxID=2842303 RepID=A0ABS6BD08_9NOCA|nr:hypothetical protein [Nocardia albiluteola]MBU3068172.1 hypothetical protein [Nocardia albiluteola]